MKLWLLKFPHASWSEDDAMVVRAANEQEARAIAKSRCCACRHDEDVWKDAFKTTCVEVTVKGKAGVVLKSNVGA